MTFALKLPHEVARIIASMQDPFLDRVRAEGGTPSCRALANYRFEFDPPHPEFSCQRRENRFVVTKRTQVLSCPPPCPNIAVYEVLSEYYQEERVFIDIRTSHGEYEHNRSLRPYNSPVTFRNFACYDRRSTGCGEQADSDDDQLQISWL
jgi:hypothetical protein